MWPREVATQLLTCLCQHKGVVANQTVYACRHKQCNANSSQEYRCTALLVSHVYVESVATVADSCKPALIVGFNPDRPTLKWNGSLSREAAALPVLMLLLI